MTKSSKEKVEEMRNNGTRNPYDKENTDKIDHNYVTKTSYTIFESVHRAYSEEFSQISSVIKCEHKGENIEFICKLINCSGDILLFRLSLLTTEVSGMQLNSDLFLML